MKKNPLTKTRTKKEPQELSEHELDKVTGGTGTRGIRIAPALPGTKLPVRVGGPILEGGGPVNAANGCCEIARLGG